MISARSAAPAESAVTVAINDYHGARPKYGRILPIRLKRERDRADYLANHAHTGTCGLHSVPCLIDARKVGHLKGHHYVCPALVNRKRPSCECQTPKAKPTPKPRAQRDAWL